MHAIALSAPGPANISPKPLHRWLVWTLLLVPLLVIAAVVTVLSTYWPYSEKIVTSSLQDTFQANVSVEKFHRFFLPHPGCELDDVTLSRLPQSANVPPLVTVQKIRIVGRYFDLITRPHHLAHIQLDGLHVRILATVNSQRPNQSFQLSSTSKVSVGSVTANTATLEIVRVSEFGDRFLRELVLSGGKFLVRDGHFQQDTQQKVNELSARALGKKLRNPADAPSISVDQLASNVTIQNAIAHFSLLYFQLPGARAGAQGTYNLLNSQVDLRGDLWTNATVSQDTKDFWSTLLTPADPLFRRKHAGAMVAVAT